MLPESSQIKRARRSYIVANQVAEQLKQIIPNIQDFLSSSIPRTRISIKRDRKSAYNELWHHYFSSNCTLGLYSLQKITVALRMLAYGLPADILDEKFQLGVTTVIDSMKMFCKTIMSLYSEQYLRDPSSTELARLLKEGEERGFPGMLRLYALDMEILPYSMARAISWS